MNQTGDKYNQISNKFVAPAKVFLDTLNISPTQFLDGQLQTAFRQALNAFIIIGKQEENKN